MIKKWLKEVFDEVLEEKINLLQSSRHTIKMNFQGEGDPINPEEFFQDSTYLDITTGKEFILQTKWAPIPKKPGPKKKPSEKK